MDQLIASCLFLDLQIMDFELSETDVELLNKTGINQRLGSFKM